MSGEIQRFSKNPGKPVQIIGAKPITERTPEILDSMTPGEPPKMEVRTHEEVTIEGNKLRSPKREEHAPEVRIRHTPTGQQFDQAKRGEDE